MQEKLNVAVIIGSTRAGRFSEKPAHWIMGELQKHSDINAELLDLRDYPLPLFNEPISPSSRKELYTEEPMAAWQKKIGAADAFIIVSPEYNHGYSAATKNALDYLSGEWHRKPVAFISYGTVGGARAVEQLRQVVIDLRMAPLAAAIHMLGEPLAALKAAQSPVDSMLFAPYAEKAEKLIAEILWWGNALKAARTK